MYLQCKRTRYTVKYTRVSEFKRTIIKFATLAHKKCIKAFLSFDRHTLTRGKSFNVSLSTYVRTHTHAKVHEDVNTSAKVKSFPRRTFLSPDCTRFSLLRVFRCLMTSRPKKPCANLFWRCTFDEYHKQHCLKKYPYKKGIIEYLRDFFPTLRKAFEVKNGGNHLIA